MWSVVLSLVVVGCLNVDGGTCGTPDFNCRFVDVWFLNVVYAMRPLM